jgi:hypothetical protein
MANGASADGATPSANSLGDYTRAGARYGFVDGPVDEYNTHAMGGLWVYQVALRFIKAGAGIHAAHLIRDKLEPLLADGLVSPNQIAYHWVLAVMSGRSFEQLDNQDLDDIRQAGGLVDRSHPDEWLAAHDALRELLDSLQAPEKVAFRPDGLSPLDDVRGRLTDARKADFDRHLFLMVEGASEHHLEWVVRDAARQRRAGKRAARAHYFFEPTPLLPPDEPVQEPYLTRAGWTLAYLALAAALGGLGLMGYILHSSGVLRAAIVPLAILVSAVVASVCLVRYFAAVERLADKEHEFGQLEHHVSRYSTARDDATADQSSHPDPYIRAVRTTFAQVVTSCIDEQFASSARWSPPWNPKTGRRLKAALRQNILRGYLDQPDPLPSQSDEDLRPGSVNWLIRYRAAKIKKDWSESALEAYRDELRPPLGTVAGVVLGVLALLGTTIYGFVETLGVQLSNGGFAALLLIVAAGLAERSHADVYFVHKRRHGPDVREARERLEREQQEHGRWQQELLSNKPSDAEVARWLDYDKIYVAAEAMLQLSRARRDTLACAIVTEPAEGCVGARYPFGPPRYSSCRVTAFLLTHAGVRQVTVLLDFETGKVYNQHRRSFRYDAITSTTNRETGIRFGRRRQATSASAGRSHAPYRPAPATQHHGRSPVPSWSTVLREDFLLRMENAEAHHFAVESFAATFQHPDEDRAAMLSLALETSGVGVALDLLETASSHSPQWVKRRPQSA